jgi:predicted dehydrogenase
VHRLGHQMRALPVVAERPGAAEDSFNVRFELASGLQGVILQTAAAWGPMVSVTRVVGSEGTLWLEKGEAWLAAIEGRATEESFATFADGLATMEVIDAIRRSAAEGGELVRVGQDAG